MLIEVQYTSDDDRADLIAKHSDKQLVKDRVLLDGGFLTFSTDELEQSTVYINIDGETIEGLKQRQDATDAAVLQLLIEGMM